MHDVDLLPEPNVELLISINIIKSIMDIIITLLLY